MNAIDRLRARLADALRTIRALESDDESCEDRDGVALYNPESDS